MTKRKITELTPAQLRLRDEFHADFYSAGISIEPAGRERAEVAITEMYRLMQEPRPAFVWCDSPLSVALARHVLKQVATDESSLWSSLESSLESSLWSSLESSLWSSLRSSLPSGDVEFPTFCWGSTGLGWIAFYRFCEEIGVMYESEASRLLKCWEDIGRSLLWWSPYKNVCFISERPASVSMEPWDAAAKTFRLHNESGPAVSFRDGWSIYALHGVLVPERVVTQDFSAADVDGEQNAEVRRIMIERYGQERYLLDSDAQLVHEDDWGKLWRKPIPNDEPLVMVEVINSTPEPDGSFKNYFLRVPPHINIAREAVAWTFDLPSQAYSLLAES